MIVNLVGPQGVGKSTFAQWFTERNKGWIHCDIAANRLEAVGRLCSPTIIATERYAWKKLRYQCREAKNCLIESTGLDTRIENLWTPELVRRGIYTVKLEASTETCQERCIRRGRVSIDGYDVDECYALSLEAELQGKMHANIIAWVEKLEEVDEVYEAIEKCILRATDLFDESQI